MSADVMVAQNPQAVQSALSNYAAPATAYKTKHAKGHAYVELNGYVALGGSYEWVKNPNSYSFSDGSWAAGPALPIGVELGFSTSGGSLSLLLQAIDLGT